MAKDPAFLFYPGDYLRDTQTLSERVQVAYDRIMCEHMRNICIRHEQLKFFTKRLTDDERDELMFVLEEVEGGYQIPWVAESISKRKAYSESRRKNRQGKSTKTHDNISSTYVEHMENEIENEDVNRNKKENATQKIEMPYGKLFAAEWELWKKFRRENRWATYKPIGEQAALLKITKLSNSEQEAIEIVRQSIENGWKGFFELKQKQNGKLSPYEIAANIY